MTSENQGANTDNSGSVSDRDKLRAQLEQWGTELDQMIGKAAGASREVQTQIESAVTDMRTRMSEAQKKLEEQVAETSQEVKTEIESAATELRSKMAEAQKQLEELGKQGDAAADDIEVAFQKSWDELKVGFNNAMSKF